MIRVITFQSKKYIYTILQARETEGIMQSVSEYNIFITLNTQLRNYEKAIDWLNRVSTAYIIKMLQKSNNCFWVHLSSFALKIGQALVNGEQIWDDSLFCLFQTRGEIVVSRRRAWVSVWMDRGGKCVRTVFTFSIKQATLFWSSWVSKLMKEFSSCSFNLIPVLLFPTSSTCHTIPSSLPSIDTPSRKPIIPTILEQNDAIWAHLFYKWVTLERFFSQFFSRRLSDE